MSDSDAEMRSPARAAGSDFDDTPRDTSPRPGNDDAGDKSDLDGNDSDLDLSEVDEAEFADFDPKAVELNDRPLADIDEDVVRTLKAGKRKKTDGDAPKKPREGKRDKIRKKKPRGDDEASGGEEVAGKRRARRPQGERRERTEGARERRKPSPEPENDENLTPEERRRKALDRAMDAALKNPNKRRRKKDEVDLEEALDDEIAALKIRMEKACEADNAARENGQPALHKLKMLPEVVAMMNRNTVQHSIVDPDTNFLQSVKFFLEPLNDGSLPSYTIQRDLFAALSKLPIEKEALLSSGIGKVVLYYTKSKRPEIGIKRIAEKLLGEWSRPILKRSDDYKKRKIATAEFDVNALAFRPPASQSSSQRPQLSQRELERERFLAPTVRSNRARLEESNTSYSIAPRSTFDPARAMDPSNRPIGAGGMEAFRRMTSKQSRKRG